MMSKHRKTLLTVVAEAALEKALVREARALGVQQWTVTEVHGAGHEGVREGQWEADRTIEVKLVCDVAVADAVAERLLAAYAPHFSVTMHFSEVWVLRPERF
jgi:nitrogen regulatory protein PII